MNLDRILLALTLAVLAFLTYQAQVNPVGRWQVTPGGFGGGGHTYLVDTRTGLVCELDASEYRHPDYPIERSRCSTAPPAIADAKDER